MARKSGPGNSEVAVSPSAMWRTREWIRQRKCSEESLCLDQEVKALTFGLTLINACLLSRCH